MIATVLARTSTLRVTTNVTNLPLRPPFVLAKTVASLDVLSRGRVELGLGAGGFWDAIEAAGGPRRTPGEALRALEEGIEVIRGVWDTSERSVRVDGEHYRVAGVHPGPAPLHDVEIWIGAIGPKMLELTGRVGDGWLPSQSYVPPDTLAERNARIDDAAVAAGRDPVAVRRLYNVNPSDDPAWAGVARRADAHPRHQHVHRHRRRPGDHPAVRHRGRARRCATWWRPSGRAAPEPEPHRPFQMGDGGARRRLTTAYAAAAARPGTSRPARRTTHPTRRSRGPRTSARPASTSSTCTTTCAPSSPSCST